MSAEKKWHVHVRKSRTKCELFALSKHGLDVKGTCFLECINTSMDTDF